MSPPELKLWSLLRRSPNGVRFRRQYPIGPYVADFYCPSAKLIIEVDGLVHDNLEAAARDQVRDDYLRSLGLSVIRVPAIDVLKDAVAVADGLIGLCGPSTTQVPLPILACARTGRMLMLTYCPSTPAGKGESGR